MDHENVNGNEDGTPEAEAGRPEETEGTGPAGGEPTAEQHPGEEAQQVEAELMVAAPVVHPLAFASLACGIGGLVATPLMVVCCIFAFGPLLGLAGIICGIIAILKIKEDPERYTGKGIAVAGIVTGAVGFVLAVVASVLFAVVGAASAAAS
jgi:uncharacterized membrane protein